MASGKICLLAALCSFVILTTFIGGAQSASCCLRNTQRKFKCQKLMDYSIQTINKSCDIYAVIFRFAMGWLCADPSDKWVQRGMKCIDERKRINATRTNSSA